MESLLRFIVRYKTETLSAGEICVGRETILDEPADSKRSVQAYNPDNLSEGVWVPRDSLLLLTEFLKNEGSRTRFWSIAQNRHFFESRKVLPFITRPKKTDRTGRYGHTPWRFESKGEALYYAKTRRLDKQKHSIIKSQHIQFIDA